MNEHDDGGPAFPYGGLEPDPETRQIVGTIYKDNEGMSLRDYFAAKAMQGWLASFPTTQNPRPELTAPQAYAFADAMLAWRRK